MLLKSEDVEAVLDGIFLRENDGGCCSEVAGRDLRTGTSAGGTEKALIDTRAPTNIRADRWKLPSDDEEERSALPSFLRRR